jgi:tetratricopeptide (TPR) repeat protein
VSDIGGDIVEMRRRYERAAALFRELDDRQGLCSTLATMMLHGGCLVFDTVVVSPGIEPDAVVPEALEALALARDITWRAGEAYALLDLGACYNQYGQYGVALEYTREGLAIASEIEHREWMTHGESTHGAICSGILEQAAADEHFSQAYGLGRAARSTSSRWPPPSGPNSAHSRATTPERWRCWKNSRPIYRCERSGSGAFGPRGPISRSRKATLAAHSLSSTNCSRRPAM